ncbi:MAG: SLC13 family permease, partial [Spirochaetota bacterium]
MINVIIFFITYFCIAIGGIPGLAIDRTGLALLGASAMVIAGAVSPSDAVAAVDLPTILLLFGLMIVSAQFRLSGFYAFAAGKISESPSSPGRFLFVLMSVTALMSA